MTKKQKAKMDAWMSTLKKRAKMAERQADAADKALDTAERNQRLAFEAMAYAELALEDYEKDVAVAVYDSARSRERTR
jgi:hypothetical protein